MDRTVCAFPGAAVINGNVCGDSKQQVFMLPSSEDWRSGIMRFGAIHSPVGLRAYL